MILVLKLKFIFKFIEKESFTGINDTIGMNDVQKDSHYSDLLLKCIFHILLFLGFPRFS